MDSIGTDTLRSFLEFRARAWSDKECLIFEDKDCRVVSYTYRQCNDHATRFAGMLLSKGIRSGDKVVVHLRNCPEFLFSWFGLAKIGAVMVPTNVLSTAPELEHFINYSDAVGVITEPDYVSLFQDVLPRCPKLRELFLVRTVSWYPTAQLFPEATVLDNQSAPVPELPPVPLQSEDDALIIFSGNTLARNSAVVLTHANAIFAGIFGSQAMKVVSTDRHFVVLPLFHVNGLFISCMPVLTAGATLVMTEQFSASRYMEQVRRYEVTTSSLVGATVRMILNQPPHELDRSNKLRLIAFAIPISDEEWAQFEQRFNVRLCDLWGMTETLGATTINPIDGKIKRNCQGLPRLGNEVKIVDEQGREQPPGTVGEIVVKGIPGRTIMKGYYKEPDTTQAVLRDGWLHTGDLGVMDEEGYFYFRGRIKEVIKRAGENVASPEVEQVIAQHPKVKEAAIVSIPDPIRDEAIVACVVVQEDAGCTEEELLAWCSQRLAKFKVPSRIVFRRSLPRNADGTVRKDILKREISTQPVLEKP